MPKKVPDPAGIASVQMVKELINDLQKTIDLASANVPSSQLVPNLNLAVAKANQALAADVSEQSADDSGTGESGGEPSGGGATQQSQ